MKRHIGDISKAWLEDGKIEWRVKQGYGFKVLSEGEGEGQATGWRQGTKARVKRKSLVNTKELIEP